MKTEKNELAECQVELKLVFDAEEAKKIDRKALNSVASKATIQGFRRGKAPLEMVKKVCAQNVAMARFDMLSGYLREAIESEKIDLFSVRELKDFKFEEGDWHATYIVEKRPVFDLPVYKGLEIAPAETTVPEEEVDHVLDNMRESSAKYENAEEGTAAAEGDIVQYDFSIEVDGRKGSEAHPDKADAFEQQGAWATVAKDDAMASNIAGMKTGETKEFAYTFGEDFAVEELRGREGKCTATLKMLRSKTPASDEELLKDAVCKDMDELRGKIRKTLETRKTQQEEARRYEQAADAVVSKCDFELPKSQVDSLADATLEEYKKRAISMGIGADYISKNRDKIVADAHESAVRQIKAWYIAGAICKAEGISCEPRETLDKAVAFILDNAKK